MVGSGDSVTVGAPLVANAAVTAEVLEHGRAKKIRIVKFKRRKHYRRQMGHRQNYTRAADHRHLRRLTHPAPFPPSPPGTPGHLPGAHRRARHRTDDDMAHKKAGGSTRNGRDSISKRLGVKKFGGEEVIAGNIIVAPARHSLAPGRERRPGQGSHDLREDRRHGVVPGPRPGQPQVHRRGAGGRRLNSSLGGADGPGHFSGPQRRRGSRFGGPFAMLRSPSSSDRWWGDGHAPPTSDDAGRRGHRQDRASRRRGRHARRQSQHPAEQHRIGSGLPRRRVRCQGTAQHPPGVATREQHRGAHRAPSGGRHSAIGRRKVASSGASIMGRESVIALSPFRHPSAVLPPRRGRPSTHPPAPVKFVDEARIKVLAGDGGNGA